MAATPDERPLRGAPRSLVRLLAAAIACACASQSHTNQAPAAADITRYARLLQMADARTLDTGLVLASLRHGRSAEREAAARAVGQVHGTAMAGELRTLLADRDTAVAANAAYALGLMRDSASVSALAAALRSAPTVAVEAAWALGRIGEAARATIISSLKTAGLPSTTAAALLLAASALRPAAAEVIAPYIAHPDSEVRWRAVYVVARPYVASGVRTVLPLAGDPSASVRAQVARALHKRAAGDSLSQLAIPKLDTLVRDPDAHVRVNAVRSLASYGAASGAPVVAALRDADANVRIAAAQELGLVLEARRKAWVDAWAADTSLAFRRAVLASALSVDVVLEGADTDNPDSWRHQSDWRLRAAVADAGGAGRIEQVREVSLPLARDPDPRVREAAYAAMAPHADTAQRHPWRREFMYGALHDRDAYVRAVGIGSLIPHANAAELPRVLDSYARSAHDSVPDARIAAAQYVASAWQRDSASFSDSLQGAVRALPVPGEMLVRDAADSVSILSAWKNAPRPQPAPVAVYERAVREQVLPTLAGQPVRCTIATVRGTITLELFGADAPLTALNFVDLAKAHYFDSVTFHRVVPNFVAQDGDPRGDGNGGPPYTIRDELNRHRYDRGAVGMALNGPDSGASQYFLTLSPQPHLDGGYTVFGRVVDGFDVMDALVQFDSIRTITASPPRAETR